jgi:hypothetical protein
VGLIYTECVFEGTISTTGADVTLWTVPAGYRDVIVDCVGYTTNSGGGAITLRTPAGYFLAMKTAAAGDPFHFSGRQAVDAGTVVKAFSSVQPWQLRITVYRLTLP